MLLLNLVSIIFCVQLTSQSFDIVSLLLIFMFKISGQTRRLVTYQRLQDSLSSRVFLRYGNSAEKSVWAGIISNMEFLAALGALFYLSRRLKLLPSFSCLLPYFSPFPSKTL